MQSEKGIFGFATPVDLGDKVAWRSMNMGYNFQAQYAVPTAPIYWWDKFDRALKTQTYSNKQTDGTREYVYTAIELWMNRKGKNGRKCLLRTICEMAETPISHRSLTDEVLNLVFR